MALTEVNLNDPVTLHMRRDSVTLRQDMCVGVALAWLRDHPPAGRISYLYVVDAEERLCGVLPTRRLLLSALEKPLTEIMVPHVVTLLETATVLEACEFFIQHKFLALPVVDATRRLVGVVDVELYTEERVYLDAVARREDLFQLIGVHLAAAQMRSPLAAVRSRFPWLLCNVAGGILAAFITGIFEEELKAVVALALFIPVVLALAESVSIQSVSLALQTLHQETPAWRAVWTSVRSELLTGLGLGVLCGATVAAVCVVWLRQTDVALCILGGIAGGVTIAAGMGFLVPTLLRLLQREPQVAAGPIALAAADMATLLLYFSLARWIL